MSDRSFFSRSFLFPQGKFNYNPHLTKFDMSMNTICFQTQLSQVGDHLNEFLRREGIPYFEEHDLNAKIKRTYPKED